MELIKRGTDYALRALVHLAMSQHGVESAASIAHEALVPQTFLQKIMQKLTRAGLVVAHVGASGGLSLAKDPAQITLKEIIDATQGEFKVSRCLLRTKKACSQAGSCPLTAGWSEVQQKFDEFLRDITLADLVERARKTGQLV